MDIIVYYEGLEDLSSLAVSSEDTDYPKENLQDRSPETLFKPASVASPIVIDMDFGLGSELAADSLILLNHNLYTKGCGIKLAYDDTGFPADDAYVIGSAGAYHEETAADEPIWKEEFVKTAVHRYWTLTIENTLMFWLGGILLGSKYTGEVFLPRVRTLQPHLAIDYTHSGVRIAVEKGATKRYREYNTYSRTSAERASMNTVAEAIGSMYHSIVLYVADESLLMQAEFVNPFKDSLRRHEDNRWKFTVLEIPQVGIP